MWRISAFDRDGREVQRLDVPGGEITIGRDGDRHLVLPSTAVSRRHARLVLDEPQPYVLDEGSANGVRVNGVLIAGPTAVAPGVRIDIADFHLELDRSSPAQSPPPPMSMSADTVRPQTAAYDETLRAGRASESLRLIALGGPFAGRVFEIPGDDVGVGRALDNELCFDDPSLSRKHARLRRVAPRRFEVEDLGSSNGTFINDRKIGSAALGPGDTLRLGDLVFRVEGISDPASEAEPWQSRGRQRLVIFGVAGAALLLVALGGAAVLLRGKPRTTASDPLIQQAQQASEYIRQGQALLGERKFESAAAEFDKALVLDPGNDELRRLKAQAESEPQNERYAKLVIKRGDAGERTELEAAARFLDKIPGESVFRAPTAKKLSEQLVLFGRNQCKARKYLDCAWALCRSYEVAPAGDRPPLDVAALLKETERKLGKDPSWPGCKAKLPN